jgi:hypothetical protein
MIISELDKFIFDSGFWDSPVNFKGNFVSPRSFAALRMMFERGSS